MDSDLCLDDLAEASCGNCRETSGGPSFFKGVSPFFLSGRHLAADRLFAHPRPAWLFPVR